MNLLKALLNKLTPSKRAQGAEGERAIIPDSSEPVVVKKLKPERKFIGMRKP